MPNPIVGDTPVFDLRTYDCRLSYMDDTLRWLRPVLIGIFALVPNMIIVIVTTVLLLVTGLPVIFETLFQVFSRFSRSLLSYFQGPKLSNSRFFKV